MLLQLEEGLKVKPMHPYSPYSHLFLYLLLVRVYDTFLFKIRTWTLQPFLNRLIAISLQGFTELFWVQKSALTEETSGLGLLLQPQPQVPHFILHCQKDSCEHVEIVVETCLISSLVPIHGFFQTCQNRCYIYRFSTKSE